MTSRLNPYEQSTPEYQLYEQIKSLEFLVRTYSGDVERYTQRRDDAVTSLERYKAVLAKLTEGDKE